MATDELPKLQATSYPPHSFLSSRPTKKFHSCKHTGLLYTGQWPHTTVVVTRRNTFPYCFIDKPLAPILVPFDQIFFLCSTLFPPTDLIPAHRLYPCFHRPHTRTYRPYPRSTDLIPIQPTLSPPTDLIPTHRGLTVI